jgi:hypothetical protein
MKTLKIASMVIALLAGIAGVIAAFFWLESAKISIDPPERFEPVDQADQAMFWTFGAISAFVKSAALNKKAALLTAISVLLSTIAGILASFS